MSEGSERNSNLTEAQAKVQCYFERHNLEEILSDMLNTLAHSPDDKPLIFMVGNSFFFPYSLYHKKC